MQFGVKLSPIKVVSPESNGRSVPEVSVSETVAKSQSTGASEAMVEAPLRMQVRRLNFFYGKAQALRNINLDIATNRVTALIGPSGCGKSTLLRTLNRMHETMRNTRL